MDVSELEAPAPPVGHLESSAPGASDRALESLGFGETLPVELVLSLIMSWKGGKYELAPLYPSDTVGDLKQLIWSITSVPPDRMKLLNLVKGKLPADETDVRSLGIPEGKPKMFMMVGTPEGEELKETGPTYGDATSEADVDYSASQKAAMHAAQSIRNRRKLAEAASALTIDVISPPRQGKKLLVIDLDYCILDTGLWKEGSNFNASHYGRPYLHKMLETLSEYYDIAFWSQTSWRWLEQKLVELEIIGEQRRGNYEIKFVLDRTPMFSVFSEREGKPFKHEVKALGIIWSKFPEFYDHKNTIHIDDLSRNFALNPRNGIKVKAYKDSIMNAATDVELIYVTRYLLQLALHPDFTKLDHGRFRRSEAPIPGGKEDPVAKAGLPKRG